MSQIPLSRPIDQVTRTQSQSIPLWVWLNAGALTLVVAHQLIDFHIGLTGPSSLEMSGLQALNILLGSMIFGWWAVMFVLAGRGSRIGLLGLLVMSLLVSFLGNGIVALGACPPPCEGAFPYQDMAHIGNVIIGGAAAYTVYQVMKVTPGRTSRWVIAVPIVLQMLSWTTTTMLFLANIQAATT
jgi:hypothetical protein